MFQYKQFQGVLQVNSTIQTVGLRGIREKFDIYNNAEEYISDIKNLASVYARHSGLNNIAWDQNNNEHSTIMSILITDDEEVEIATREFKKECLHDVKCIRECVECFQNWINDHQEYFVKACNFPHLLVLAKFGHFPHWPAKVMSVLGDKVSVEFFGDHTRADVSDNDCYLYRKPRTSKDPPFKAAVEVRLYFFSLLLNRNYCKLFSVNCYENQMHQFMYPVYRIKFQFHRFLIQFSNIIFGSIF